MVTITKNEVYAAAIAAIVVALIAGLLVYSLVIKSGGRIIGIGIEIYEYQGSTEQMTHLNWGNISVGEQKHKVVWIRNTRELPVELSVQFQNYDPENITMVLILGVEFNAGINLSPNQQKPITLTVTHCGNFKGFDYFTYDTIITATEIES